MLILNYILLTIDIALAYHFINIEDNSMAVFCSVLAIMSWAAIVTTEKKEDN